MSGWLQRWGGLARASAYVMPAVGTMLVAGASTAGAAATPVVTVLAAGLVLLTCCRERADAAPRPACAWAPSHTGAGLQAAQSMRCVPSCDYSRCDVQNSVASDAVVGGNGDK